MAIDNSRGLLAHLINSTVLISLLRHTYWPPAKQLGI